ncbi:hypothetical protein Tco_1162412, partial [Tanacetum coccineum]
MVDWAAVDVGWVVGCGRGGKPGGGLGVGGWAAGWVGVCGSSGVTSVGSERCQGNHKRGRGGYYGTVRKLEFVEGGMARNDTFVGGYVKTSVSLVICR